MELNGTGAFSLRGFFASVTKQTNRVKGCRAPAAPGGLAEPFPTSSPARRAAYARAAGWLNRALHHQEGMRLAVTRSSAHLGDADKKGAYPAWAKPSVLVTLRMKRSPERRQPMRGMSCPSCGAPGCAARPSLTLWWEVLAPTTCLALQRGTLQSREELCEHAASVPSQ